ncbi:MAG: choice-of-anchor D domain-containing protein [Candidatus Acidiferrales bacterium]
MRRLVFVTLAVLAGLLPVQTSAQNTISTVAGGQLPNNVPNTGAGLEGVYGVVRDSTGNLYVITDVGVIYKATPSGTTTIYAGNITGGYTGDGKLATAATLDEPFAGALDANGNLYFSDSQNCVIRKITASTGIITTVVGNGNCNYTGDRGPAGSATLNFPQGVAIDALGDIFIVDYNNDVVRRVDGSTNVITTFAGTGNVGYAGDGGAATQATLNFPVGVATDTAGNVYIADAGNNVVRFVNATTDIITTVAGTGNPGYAGDGGQATSALLTYPAAVAVDSSNNLYIADTDNAVIRKVDGNHNITTIIGNNQYGFGGDGGPALQATLTNPFGVAVDGTGDVWVADYWNNRIRMYSAATGIFNSVVGNGSVYDGLAATSGSLYFPRGPALDSQGNLYITDEGNNRIREVSATTGIISTVAGTNVPCAQPTLPCGDGGQATAAAFYGPHSVNLDPTDTYMNIADSGDNRLRQVNTDTGIISTIAGTGIAGFSGDGGPASAAQINSPRAPNYDSLGNLYFVDTSNHRVRKIDKTTGFISTVVGSGGFASTNQGCQNGGYTGDGGPATMATLQCPLGLAIDANDNLYIADYLNSAIREVDAKTQIITTIVGNGTPGYTGDNGPASKATLSFPDRVSVNGAGNLFISDTGNNVVRRVDALTQIITTFAGSGAFGFSGDGGPALSAALAQPTGVVVTDSGDLYLGDLLNNRIRKVTLNSAVTFSLSTVAFGNQAINSTSGPQMLTLTNSGDAPLAIANVGVTSESGAFALSGNTCGTTVAVGAQCSLSITFSPTSFGALTGTFTITDNAPVLESTQMVALTGTGAASLTVTLAGAGTGSVSSVPAGINCGATCSADFTEGTSVVLTATTTNGSTFAGWSGACTNTSGTCTVVMSQNQTVTATFNASSSGSVTVTPSSLTFPSQNVGTTSSPMSVTVVNNGTATVTFAGFTVTGTNASDFGVPLPNSGMMCSPTGTLAGGEYCQISVLFAPSASGTRTATLNVADSATGSPQKVTLSGTGNNSPVTITVPSGGSTTGTATPGGTAFFGLQITGAPGVTGTVQFGCTPSSPTITCNVIPSSITLTGKPIEIAFGVQTYCQGATNTGFAPSVPRRWPAGGITLLLLSLALGGIAWAMQRNRRVALTFAVLMLVALGTAACGSLAKGPDGATPPGTYMLSLSTTVNGQTQTMPNFLTLVVK